MKKKYALVLSGGGFKGAFQLGALEYIMEYGISNDDGTIEKNPTFSIIAGVSVGALNGALMAMDNFAGLQQLWQNIEDNGLESIYTSELIEVKGDKVKPQIDNILKKIIPQSGFETLFGLLFSKKGLMKEAEDNLKKIKSLADNSPLYDQLKREVTCAKFKVPFRMGFTSLVDGTYHSPYTSDFDNDDELAKAVLASAALPLMFAPIESIRYNQNGNSIIAKQVTDGGVTNISPLIDAITHIKDNDLENIQNYHIVIINCSAEKIKIDDTDFPLAKTAFRVTDSLLTNEVLKNDYQNFIMINDLVTQASASGITLVDAKDPQKRPYIKFEHTIIQPNDPNIPGNDVGDTLDSRKGTLIFRRKEGWKKAKEAFNSDN